MRAIKDIYEAYRDGNNVTNVEVIRGYTFFRRLADDLVYAGPVFNLAFKEANMVAAAFEQFGHARGLIDSSGNLIKKEG